MHRGKNFARGARMVLARVSVLILFASVGCITIQVAPTPEPPAAPTQDIPATSAPIAPTPAQPTSLPKVEPTRAQAPATTGANLPAAHKKFASTVSVSIEGDSVVLKSNGVPDHPSPYFDRSDKRYEAYSGTNRNYQPAPGRISEQNLILRVPLNPQKAASPARTQLGAIGMAINGVAIFNQYQAQNQPLGNEINSFDQYNGHPQQEGMYHYHIEPLFLTAKNGKASLIGFLLDGFPVYGPAENGKTITNNDLDGFHGHSHATPEYSNGIYHYHITAESPYINGNGYYGTPGTLERGQGGQPPAPPGAPPIASPQPKPGGRP